MPRAMLRAVLILAVLSPSAALAQSMVTMTLPDALAYARAHQPQIKSALAQFAARRAEAQVARAQWLPQVGATAQIFGSSYNNTTAMYLATPETDIPRVGGRPSAPGKTFPESWAGYPSTIAALSVNQQVYDFGRISAQIAMADAVADEAHASADAMQLDVQLTVEEAYASALAAHHVLTATEEALKRAVTHRDYAAAGVRSGLQPPVNLTRAQADVAQLDVRRIQALSGLDVARAALAASIGSDRLQIETVEIAADASPAPALEAVFREAAAKNPAIVAALARLHASTADVKATTRELLPDLFASAGLSGRAGGAPNGDLQVATGGGWLPDIPNWDVGLVLHWNVFDGTIWARRKAAQARQEAAQFDLETARMAVDLASERAWLDLDAAVKALPGLQTNVDAARANFAQADARFRAGLGTIIEMADAESLLINAQLQLAVGQFTVARTRAALGRVVGRAVYPLMTKVENSK
jgi:outer membrane protein TolC